MQRRSIIVVSAVLVFAAAGACSKKKSASPPIGDFALKPLVQSALSLPPGGGQAIPIAIDRSGGYSGPIDVAVSSAPSGVTSLPLTIAADSTGGFLSIAIGASAAVGGPFPFDVTATGGGNSHAQPARVYVVQTTFGLDASLGSAGTLTTTCGGACRELQDVAFTPDDGMVATTIAFAGTNETFTLAKFTALGAPDTTFGSGGVDTLSIPNVTSGEAEHVAVDSQGRIVVAGVDLNATPMRTIVCRLHPDGSVDTSFASTGCTLNYIGSFAADVFDLKIDQEGRIYIAGEGYDSNTGNTVGYVMRFLDDGEADVGGFNSDGSAKVITADGTFIDQIDLDELFTSGPLFMIGVGSTGWAVWRYDLDGKGHSGFGQTAQGFTQSNVSGGGDTLAVSSYGDILGAGYYQLGSPYPEAIGAFASADGSVDTTYGTNGVSTAAYDSSNVGIVQMFYEDSTPNVTAWLVGTTNPGTSNRTVVLSRMDAHVGGLDTTIGTSGFFITTVDGHPTYAAAAKRDAYGRIVVVEGFSPGTGTEGAIQRFFAP